MADNNPLILAIEQQNSQDDDGKIKGKIKIIIVYNNYSTFGALPQCN